METQKRRRPNEKQQQENPETSIEDLPKEVLIHIISFLPSIDAIRSTAIAPAWRNLWHSVHHLEFDMIPFHSNIPDLSIREARDLFADFISDTLYHRLDSDFHLQKFKLRFCYRNNLAVKFYIDTWLSLLTERQVLELDLHFQFHSYHQNPAIPLEEEGDDAEHDPFSFYSPQFVDFSDTQVEVLKLHGVCFRIPGTLKFDSVKEVHLEHFHSSDKDVENLMASCVNIESLSLVSGGGCNHLKIVSQKLKHFKLVDFNVVNFQESSIEICAPSLLSINLAYVYAEKFLLKKTSSLVKAEVVFLQRSWWDLAYWTNVVRFLSGIESLTIQHMWDWSEELPDKMDEPFKTSEEVENHTPEGEGFDIPIFVPKEFYLKLQPRMDVFSDNFEFHNLKHLELLTSFSGDDIATLELVFIRCPELVSVVFISKYEFPQDDDDNEWLRDNGSIFYLPSLKFVEIKGYGATKNELFLVELLKKCGGFLEKVIGYPKEVNGRSQPAITLYERTDLPVDLTISF